MRENVNSSYEHDGVASQLLKLISREIEKEKLCVVWIGILGFWALKCHKTYNFNKFWEI